VVIGLWHYYQNSLDDDFLFDYGAEIILETARYWAHRAEKIPGRGGYHLYGVMGPDEYKPLSNNNAYTNHCAKFNLQLASRVVARMREKAPEKLLVLKHRLAFTEDELAGFDEVEKGIAILRDESRGIVWQCEGFDTAFSEPDIDAVWEDKTKLFGTFYAQEKRYRSKTLKQADVVALLALFSEDFSAAEKAASFDYYWPFTIHDSSNSMCHHQMVLASLGRSKEAYAAWLRSIDIDYGSLPRAANGIHCANVGGMWQEVVFGFCGIVSALNTETLTLRPCLPSEFRSIRAKLLWKREWVHVTVTRNTVTIDNPSSQSLPFIVHGKEYRAEPRARREVAYGGTHV
jgi:kojibiose phosphorylase